MMVSVRILAFLALAVVGLRADQTAPRTHCIQDDKLLKCALILPNASNSSEYRELQWYQRYHDKPDSRIGITPVVDFTTRLMFVLWIEHFDNQTDIYAILNSGEGSRATIPYPIRNTNKKKYFTETKPYSESELVNITCKNGDSQVGWIDPTGNRITTYEKANHSQKFHKEDNGSIICCLRYVTQDTILNRYIEYMYTLIYEEPSTQHTHVPKAKLPFRDDYTCIEEVESCYKIHATPKNWDAAIKVCQSEGASLFYPVNSTEVNAVISFWQSTSKEIRYMYVGISDIETEGQFKTIDGTPIDEIYQKWTWNQPDNYLNNEHCLFMYHNGKYNDGPCSTPYSFICKKSLLSPERSIQHNLNTRNVITTEEPNSTKTSSSTVTILYSICGVGLTALVIVGIYWCWSTRRPQGTHGLPINQPTEPFYLNMLFRRQCDQEIAEIDQLYEEIDQHHTPGVVRG
ncbi:hypothetical protein PYW07_011302 [Mythimna separata]|uniref:C-type lectin domain-containing protein n=1 Tax=Mythimna separata TaxID=271217 RepID=A0AAD8DLV6_MYTSE|nr:hypothetical protein PYW07_011302 [Mythimna separata]